MSPLITAPITKGLINQIGIQQTFIAVGIFFRSCDTSLRIVFFKKPNDVNEGSRPLKKIKEKTASEMSILELIKKTPNFRDYGYVLLLEQPLVS